MISSMYVPICNHFYVKRANNGEITFFKGSTPLSPPHSWGPPSPSGMKFRRKIPETLSDHTVKTKSLYLTVVGSDRYRVVTNTKTDIKTELP